jgi:hypothetical protein
LVFFGPPLDDGCSPRLAPDGVGVVVDDELLVVVLELLEDDDDDDDDEEGLEAEVEVELEGEVVVELEELDEEVGVDVVVVVDVNDGIVVDELADEMAAQTGVRVAARGSASPVAAMIWSTVALSGTATVTWVPVTGAENVTEQVSSADAVGSAARPMMTRIVLASASTNRSLRRLLLTAGLLL